MQIFPGCIIHLLDYNQYSLLIISKYVTTTSGSLQLCTKIVDNLRIVP